MQTSSNGVLLGGDAIQHYQLCQEEDKEGDGRAAHYAADPSRAANGGSAIVVTKIVILAFNDTVKYKKI